METYISFFHSRHTPCDVEARQKSMSVLAFAFRTKSCTDTASPAFLTMSIPPYPLTGTLVDAVVG